MKTKTLWKEKMTFVGETGGNSVNMDAKPPIGRGEGLTPKELVALGISGCTGMDVVSLLRKYKQPLESFEILSEVLQTENQTPAIFRSIALEFRLKGALEKDKVLEAITLSQSKYCGVSAMLSAVAPISYQVFVNDQLIGSGKASF